MTTTTIKIMGSEWSEARFSGMFDLPEEEERAVLNWIVANFERTCRDKYDLHYSWTPYTAEVIGPIEEDAPDDFDPHAILEELVDQAGEMVSGGYFSGTER